MRLTEEQYEALMQKRTQEARERAESAEQPAESMGIAKPAEEVPSGPKFKSKAEARYAEILEAQRRDGNIRGWRYEGITLRLADGVRYSPDFVVFMNGGRMRLVEVKGGYFRDDARIKLRVAVEMYPDFSWLLVWAKKGRFEPELLR